MRSLAFFTAIVPGVLCLSLPQSQDSLVELVFEQDLESGNVATSIWDETGVNLLASSCSSSLDFGGQLVTVDVGKDAIGIFSVAGQTYLVEEDENKGIYCSTMYNSEHARVECQLSIKVPVEVHPVSSDSSLSCFADSEDVDRFRWLPVEDNDSVDEIVQGEDPLPGNSALERRQGCHTGIAQIQWPSVTRHPRKWRRHQQLTPSLDCNSASGCSVSISSSKSIQHTATVSASYFIDAKYQVTHQQSSGFSLTCSAGRGQRVCLKHWSRFQQYDVRRKAVRCGATITDETYAIRAPLKDQNRHSQHYCMTGTQHCRHNGYMDWEDRGQGTHGGA